MRSIGAEVTASGLELDGWTVVEPWGPTTAEIAGRRRAAMRSARNGSMRSGRSWLGAERRSSAPPQRSPGARRGLAHLRTELGAGPDTLRS